MVYWEKVNKARYNTPMQTIQSGDTYWKPRTKIDHEAKSKSTIY
jgi:hypothetical protein